MLNAHFVQEKKGFRAFAWEKFQALTPPKYEENYRRFPLKKLLEGNWKTPSVVVGLIDESLILPESDREHFLLLANGVFQKGDEKQKILPLTLSEAEERFSLFLEQRLLLQLQKENDPLALLNLSLAQEGLFLYIPPHTQIERTVQIHNHSSSAETLFSPRVHLLVGKGSSLTVCLTGLSEASSWVNCGVDILMDEESSLKLVVADESGCYSLSLHAQLKKNSHLDIVQVGGNQKLSRNNFQVKLASNAALNLSGVHFLREKSEVHTQTHVEHIGENATSFQKFKTVLEGRSVAHFNGKIYVHKEAQGTQAYQINKSLLLSDQARVFSQPRLEIFADDVKASHGATVGQLTEEELFYLLSRGLSAQTAKKLLLDGFCKEILDLVPSALIKEKFTTRCQ